MLPFDFKLLLSSRSRARYVGGFDQRHIRIYHSERSLEIPLVVFE